MAARHGLAARRPGAQARSRRNQACLFAPPEGRKMEFNCNIRSWKGDKDTVDLMMKTT